MIAGATLAGTDAAGAGLAGATAPGVCDSPHFIHNMAATASQAISKNERV
jgi:hypothetical protein